MQKAAFALYNDVWAIFKKKSQSIEWRISRDTLFYKEAGQMHYDELDFEETLIETVCKDMQVLSIDSNNFDSDWLGTCFNNARKNLVRFAVKFPSGEIKNVPAYKTFTKFRKDMPKLEHLKFINLNTPLELGDQLPNLKDVVFENSVAPNIWEPSDKLRISVDYWLENDHTDLDNFKNQAKENELRRQIFKNIPENYGRDPIENMRGIDEIFMQTVNGNFKYYKRNGTLASHDLEWMKKCIVDAVNENDDNLEISEFSLLGENKAVFDLLMIHVCDAPKEDVEAIINAVDSPKLICISTKNVEYYNELFKTVGNEKTDMEIILESPNDHSIQRRTYVSLRQQFLDTDDDTLELFKSRSTIWTHVKLTVNNLDIQNEYRVWEILSTFNNVQYIAMKSNSNDLLANVLESLVDSQNSRGVFPQLLNAMVSNESIEVSMSRDGYVDVTFSKNYNLSANIQLIPTDQRHYRLNIDWSRGLGSSEDYTDLIHFIGKLGNAESIDFAGDSSKSFFEHLYNEFKDATIFDEMNLDLIRVETEYLYKEVATACLLGSHTILVNRSPQETIFLSQIDEIRNALGLLRGNRVWREPSGISNVFSNSFVFSSKSTANLSKEYQQGKYTGQPKMLSNELKKVFDKRRLSFEDLSEICWPPRKDMDDSEESHSLEWSSEDSEMEG